MLRLMIRLGMHGKSHRAKYDLINEWAHNNGIGA